ncbi:hypothetical protein AOLI_G00052290 [Acnodon oligacanthus]
MLDKKIPWAGGPQGKETIKLALSTERCYNTRQDHTTVTYLITRRLWSDSKDSGLLTIRGSYLSDLSHFEGWGALRCEKSDDIRRQNSGRTTAPLD